MTTPDSSMTSLDAAMANTTAAVKVHVDALNEQLKAGYLTAFHDWAGQVTAGRRDNSNPPEPPKAYVVGYFADPTTGPGTVGPYRQTVYWPYPITGTDPVCAMPPVPPTPKPYAPPVLPEPDHVRNVPPGDTMPVGFVLAAQDGTRWQKQSSPTPFGVAYFYARVA